MAAQSLLKRSPNMTKDEFTEQWLGHHAQISVPLFLHFKAEYYVQVHGPFTTTDPNLDLDLSKYSVAGELTVSPNLMTAITTPTGAAKWTYDYYHEVVQVDERRCLEDEAMKQLEIQPPLPAGTVSGRREVIIRDGKCVVEIPESVWEVWRQYEKRGEGEQAKGLGIIA
jgi:hypothetical protein